MMMMMASPWLLSVLLESLNREDSGALARQREHERTAGSLVIEIYSVT